MSDKECWGEEEGFGDVDDDESCDYGCGDPCEDPQTRDAGLCTTECQTYLVTVEMDADHGTKTWVCTGCGCTDTKPCVKYLPGAAIETCHWVRKNLCSTCANKQNEKAP